MDDFAQIIDGVREQDERAVRALVDRFEPQIRRVVRIRMLNPQLRQLIDSTDVCQSILAKFLVRARDGRYQVETPEQLRGLLLRMARNKVVDWVRRQQASRRQAGRAVPLSQVDSGALRDRSTEEPSQHLAEQEEISRFCRVLTESDRRIVHYRSEGLGWETIAGLDGQQKTPDALRMKFRRRVERAVQQLRHQHSSK